MIDLGAMQYNTIPKSEGKSIGLDFTFNVLLFVTLL